MYHEFRQEDSMFSKRYLAPVLFLGILMLALGKTSSVAQDKAQGANIKAQTTNVLVDIIVTDHKGHHVPGLSAKDFTIFEDGVAQKIAGFTAAENSSADDAGTRPDAGVAASDGATQPAMKGPAKDPHLLTVVLDLADNRPANTKQSADAVLRYLEKSVSKDDFMAIYYIDQSLHVALPFTNNLESARETLKKLETRRAQGAFSGGDRSAVQEEINDLNRQAHPETELGAVAGDLASPSGGGSSSPPSGPANNMAMLMERQANAMSTYLTIANTFQARAVFAALRAICIAYHDIPGRKNLVLFSEGFLYSDDARPYMEAVADAANRSNVSIYVIDPQGVEVNPYGGGERPTDTIGARIAAAGAPGANVGQGGGETKFDKIKQVGNLSRGDQLDWLAETTGGLSVKRTNDLVPAFGKVLDDGRDYYTLAYVPATQTFDGKFHSIKVEVNQQSYKLRYRKGYWAVPRGSAIAMTPAAAQLISSIQNGSVKASEAEVHADLLPASDGHYSAAVAVSVPGNQIPLEKEGDNDYKATINLILVVRNAQKELVAVSQLSRVVRIGQDREGFGKTIVTIRGQVAVPDPQPAPTFVEAIAQFPENAAAKGATEIVIPDSTTAGFHLSSLLLSDRAEQATCNYSGDALCFMNVRLSQPPRPEFSSGGHMIVYFAASDLSLDPTTKKPRLGVGFLLRSGNTVLKDLVAQNVQSLPGPLPNSVLVLAEFDLKSVQPGTYTLQATARDMVRNTFLMQKGQFRVH